MFFDKLVSVLVLLIFAALGGFEAFRDGGSINIAIGFAVTGIVLSASTFCSAKRRLRRPR